MDSANTEDNEMKFNYIEKAGLITLLLAILQSLIAMIFGLPTGLTYFFADLLAIFLIVAVLLIYVSNSVLRDWKLVAAAFLIYSVIGNINIHIEAIVFGVTGINQTLFLIIIGLISSLAASLSVVGVIGKPKEIPAQLGSLERGRFSWTWRIIVGVFSYFVIYISAGLMLSVVYPEVVEFYGDKIPPFDLIAITQFLRGFIFVGIAILILKTTNLSAFNKAILIGLVFSIFGGIAPLIPPNEYMPPYVRLGHGVEVGLSNFLYGLFLGYLLGGTEKRTE